MKIGLIRNFYFFSSLLFLMLGCATSVVASGVISITPSMTLAQITTLVNNSPAGSTFQFASGTYREFSLRIPKSGDTFLGGSGVILNGSQLLSSFSQKSGLWVAQGPTAAESVTTTPGICNPALKNADGTPYTVGCLTSRSLFLDSKPLWRVATLAEVASGKWYFNPTTSLVYMSDNPTGHTVEIGVTPYAFNGVLVSNIKIQGFTIEKYATPFNTAAVDCVGNATRSAVQSNGCTQIESITPAADWVVEYNTFTLNHYAGFSFLQYCSGLKLTGNQFTSNGNTGINGSKSDSVAITSNTISNNNYVGFNPSWGSGGIKVAVTTNLLVSDNTIYNNSGAGFWCDIDCAASDIYYNNIYSNTGFGIFYEISYGAKIVQNKANNNGYGQIALSNSGSSSITDNSIIVASGGGNGITIQEENRGTGCDNNGNFNAREAIGDSVSSNTIQYLGKSGVSGAFETDGKLTVFSNLFNSDTYEIGSGDTSPHWQWQSGAETFAQFQSQGQEKLGKIAGTSPSTSCIMNIPDCPNHPGDIGVFSDDYEYSKNNEARCLQRASDYYSWCGTKTPDTATYLVNGAVAATATFPSTGNTACIMNVPNCPNHLDYVGTFADDYGNAGSNEVVCLGRASAYYSWCGTKTPDTATYLVNGSVKGTAVSP